MGDVYLVKHVVRPASGYPEGVVRLIRAGGTVRLEPLAAGTPLGPLPATVVPLGGRLWRVEGPAVLVDLVAIGVDTLEALAWSAVATALGDHAVSMARLPVGTPAVVRVDQVLATPTGMELRVSRGRTVSVIPVKRAQLRAFYWDGARLELRAADGSGLALWRDRCASCGTAIDAGVATAIDGQEYCPACGSRQLAQLQRDRRRMAQLRVGVCRGCAFYAQRFEAAGFGGAGVALSECIQPERVARHGAYPAGVRSCRYRVERGRQEARPETGTVGRPRRDGASPSGRTR